MGYTMSALPETIPFFATPLVVLDLPDAAALNVELRRVIDERAKSNPTTLKSNMGGWQSSWDMDRWGGIGNQAAGPRTQSRQPHDDRPERRRWQRSLSGSLRSYLGREHVGDRKPNLSLALSPEEALARLSG